MFCEIENHRAQTVVQSAIERLVSLGLTEDELRRVFENELAQARTRGD